MPKTTIADVARLAKVSTSSVSNVLNGRSQRMRPDTQERIQYAIKQLGYTPNLAARQLKTGHSPFIGLIIPSVADPYFGSFARFVEEAALSNGYQVLLGKDSFSFRDKIVRLEDDVIVSTAGNFTYHELDRQASWRASSGRQG